MSRCGLAWPLKRRTFTGWLSWLAVDHSAFCVRPFLSSIASSPLLLLSFCFPHSSVYRSELTFRCRFWHWETVGGFKIMTGHWLNGTKAAVENEEPKKKTSQLKNCCWYYYLIWWNFIIGTAPHLIQVDLESIIHLKKWNYCNTPSHVGLKWWCVASTEKGCHLLHYPLKRRWLFSWPTCLPRNEMKWNWRVNI